MTFATLVFLGNKILHYVLWPKYITYFLLICLEINKIVTKLGNLSFTLSDLTNNFLNLNSNTVYFIYINVNIDISKSKSINVWVLNW